jgi:hypothetical protein
MTDPTSIVKQEFSGSTDGRGIKVAATSSAGTTIHTAASITGDNNYDEIWLWAVNSSATAVKLTVEWGGTTAPDDNIEVTVPPEAGLVIVSPGLILQNGLAVKAFAATTNVILLHGYVNAITV